METAQAHSVLVAYVSAGFRRMHYRRIDYRPRAAQEQDPGDEDACRRSWNGASKGHRRWRGAFRCGAYYRWDQAKHNTRLDFLECADRRCRRCIIDCIGQDRVEAVLSQS